MAATAPKCTWRAVGDRSGEGRMGGGAEGVHLGGIDGRGRAIVDSSSSNDQLGCSLHFVLIATECQHRFSSFAHLQHLCHPACFLRVQHTSTIPDWGKPRSGKEALPCLLGRGLRIWVHVNIFVICKMFGKAHDRRTIACCCQGIYMTTLQCQGGGIVGCCSQCSKL